LGEKKEFKRPLTSRGRGVNGAKKATRKILKTTPKLGGEGRKERMGVGRNIHGKENGPVGEGNLEK